MATIVGRFRVVEWHHVVQPVKEPRRRPCAPGAALAGMMTAMNNDEIVDILRQL